MATILRGPTYSLRPKKPRNNADTTRGSPRALIAAGLPAIPSGKQQTASAPARKRINADTSQSSSLALLSAGGISDTNKQPGVGSIVLAGALPLAIRGTV